MQIKCLPTLLNRHLGLSDHGTLVDRDDLLAVVVEHMLDFNRVGVDGRRG